MYDPEGGGPGVRCGVTVSTPCHHSSLTAGPLPPLLHTPRTRICACRDLDSTKLSGTLPASITQLTSVGFL